MNFNALLLAHVHILGRMRHSDRWFMGWGRNAAPVITSHTLSR